MKLYNLFEDIILESTNLLIESVDFNTVKDSIDKKYNVNIVYIDGDGVRTSRYIQPYVLGDTLASNKAIRAYQIFGGSRTMSGNEQGGWRIFRLDRIVDWKPTKMKFSVPVSDLPSFMINRGRFNPNGDQMFSRVDAIAKFGDNVQEPIQVPIQKTTPDIKQKPVQQKTQPSEPKSLSPKPSKPEIKTAEVKPNRYATGKNPMPNTEPKNKIDTSKTIGVDTSKTTAQPINKKEKYDNTTSSRFK